jgi:hypothetical protein
MHVTAITGTVNGSTITALNTFNGGDNLLFPTGTTFLSTHGISFVTAAGQDINIFSFFPQGTPPSGNAYGELGVSNCVVGGRDVDLDAPAKRKPNRQGLAMRRWRNPAWRRGLITDAVFAIAFAVVFVTLANMLWQLL